MSVRKFQNTTSIGYRHTILRALLAGPSVCGVDEETTCGRREAGSSKGQAGDQRRCSRQCGVGIETVSGNLMILALRMAARKPFEFVVYPQSSAVGVLARLLEPRPDCSVTNS